jgi:hypothetical protein
VLGAVEQQTPVLTQRRCQPCGQKLTVLVVVSNKAPVSQVVTSRDMLRNVL